jgi:hypothetical protein
MKRSLNANERLGLKVLKIKLVYLRLKIPVDGGWNWDVESLRCDMVLFVSDVGTQTNRIACIKVKVG